MAPIVKQRLRFSKRGIRRLPETLEPNIDYLHVLSKKRRLRLGKENKLRDLGSLSRKKSVTKSQQELRPKEYDLEQKIDLEIKMREGTTKLLAACKHPSQSLEAAKSLLTSNERMTAYMAELQRRKTQERKASVTDESPVVKTQLCNAKVSVSDIRMPLIWKDSDHFKNKGDYRRFAVFCLLKIGTEIYDTMMVNNVDRSLTDITFEDVIVFNHIPPDFEFRLEVYSHVLQDDLSIASTPRKIKKKISNSVSRTIGRKLAATLKEELNSFEIGPKFDLVAHATMRLCDADDSIHTHDLMLENLENPQNQLPLFGHFCCRLAVQPDCITEERYSGYLGIVQQVGNISGCRRLWASLKNFQLSFWTKAEESQVSLPVLTIPIDKYAQTKLEKGSSAYPWSFKLRIDSREKMQDYILAADSDESLSYWIAHIEQHARDHEHWGHAAETVMEIPSPVPCRLPVFLRTRHGSLYDETPLRDSPQSHSSGHLSTGSVSSILQENNHQLSPPSLRSRSSSTSSAASSTSSSRQPFSFFRLRRPSKDPVFY